MVKQELLFRYASRSGQRLPDIIGHLAADPDVHTAAVVDVDEHCLRLDVALVDALRHVGVLDDQIGLGEATLQVAFFEKGFVVGIGRLRHLLREADVGVEVGMQYRRVVLERCERFKHCRQFFVLDLNHLERALGDVLVVSGDGGHALATEADAIVGQNRHVLHRPAPQSAPDISAGDDGVDAGDLLRRSRVDADDTGVGVGTMEGLAPEGAGQGHIRRVAGLARRLLLAIYPARWLPNDLVGDHPVSSIF